MTKSLVAIATAILAATTLLTSTAEAGMRVHLGFGGLPPYMTNYNKQSAYDRKPARKRYRAARRQQKAPARQVAKKATKESVAKTEPKVEKAPAKVAETENSSISVAAISETSKADAKPVATAKPVETAAVAPDEATAPRSIDCKKFVPSVGLTLTVPCE